MNGKHFSKILSIVVITMTACTCAFAQYGGGTGSAASGGTYNPSGKSYGNGAAIGGAVAAGAGAGALLLFLHHRHAAVVGCVAPDGKSLTDDKGKHTYQLTGETIAPGERVSVKGKKSKGPSGIDELDVVSVNKDLGQCEQEQAVAVPHP